MNEIIVIDDNPEIRALIVTILDRAGYRIVEAPEGETGIAMCRATDPSLIITDIIMPKMEGLELIRELAREMPAVPILAISGADNLDLYLRAANAFGAAACLAKPFTPDELLEAVERALRSVRQTH